VTTRPELIAKLKPFRIDLQEAPIADLTMAGTKPEIVDTVMADFLSDDRVDAVLMAVGSSAEFHPDLAVAPLAKWAKADKPVVSFLLPNAPRSLELLAQAGIAGFRTPEACADVLSAYLEWRPPQDADAEALPASARERLGQARPAGSLNEQAALDLFATLGIATPRMAILKQASDATFLDLTYPVVAKILSADIAHKSDVGGVIVGIENAAALAQAASRLLTEVPKRAPSARIDGVVVQEMARGQGEAIVGFRRDPLVGPVIVVGMGGILAEVYKDVSVRPAPVTIATAREMIAEVKGFAPLRGFRGLPKGDLEALAGIVANLSRLALATDTPIAEAEINPVIVRAKSSGAIAVDGLVVLAQRQAD
jgi:acyl-CoA synthetase (NDP forming)